MAVSGRIEDVIQHADGSVEVKYTEGETPLPAAWDGNSLIFSSVQAFVDELAALEVVMAEKMKLIQLAKGYKTDPTMKAVFTAAVKGKTATLDLVGQVAPISIG